MLSFAVGMVSVELNCPPDDALAVLCGRAFVGDAALDEWAEDVVEGKLLVDRVRG